MFYEDVKVEKIWKDPKNVALVARHGKPESLQTGDVLMIPIPWTVISQALKAAAHACDMEGRNKA